MAARLLVKSKAEMGDRPAQEVVLPGDVISVGRDKACEVVLNDPVVSRTHVRITRDGALYFVEDMGSSFGTRVNSTPLPQGEKRLLRNGDVIAVGPYDLTFDRVADIQQRPGEKTSFVAKAVVKSALRGLAEGSEPFLRVMNGRLEGRRFEIKSSQEIVIGRDEDVDVRLLEDDLISRRHAKIRRDWSGTHVEDLKSRNGVRVNKKRIKGSRTLTDRDEIEVGATRFLFLDPTEVDDGVAPPTAVRGGIGGPVDEKPAPRRIPQKRDKSDPGVVGPDAGSESAGGEGAAEVETREESQPEPETGATDARSEGSPEEPGRAPGGPGSVGQGRPPLGRLSEPDDEDVPTGFRERLALALTPEGRRALVPVVIVLGAAIFALVILGIALFAI